MSFHLTSRLRAHRYALAAAGIILIAVAVRVALVALGWPGTDSDDATMGLMAKHILTQGEHPIFFWGQAYMGTIEAYLGALMFAFLGVSEFALKCGLIILYAAFLMVMYLLLTRLFSQKWALVGLLLLAGSTDDMLYHQLQAYGGYLETIFFGALLTFLATLIACRPQPGGGSVPSRRDLAPGDLARRSSRHRLLLFAAWGAAAGLAIYSDPLVLPFVGLSALLIALTQWRAVRGWLGIVALASLLVGVSPWFIYIATAHSPGAAQSFLRPVKSSSTTTAQTGPSLGERLADQAMGTIFIAIPNNTGVNALCPVASNDAWPPSQWISRRVTGCMVARGTWGIGIIALLITALMLEGSAFWRSWRRGAGKWSSAERMRAAISGGRLVAVGAPATTVLLFALSSSSGTAPWIYSRYLISLAIALPVAVAVLWRHAPHFALPLWHPVQWQRMSVALLSGFLAFALALGVAGTFTEAHAAYKKTQQQMALVHWLENTNHTRFYSNFWTCMRAIFQSDERLTCSIITDQLTIAPNRYAPYDATVAAAHPTLYLFPTDTIMARDFPAYAARQEWHLTTTTLEFDEPYVAYEVQTS